MANQSMAEQVAAFKSKNPAQKVPGGGVVHGQPVEQLKQTQSEAPATEPEVEEVPIEDKTFDVQVYSQGAIEAVVFPMTMQDICDYCCYASDLYETTTNEKGKKTIITEEQDKWQRGVNSKRGNVIAEYLSEALHFLPAMILVPTDGVVLDGTQLTVSAHSLAALDGQHRLLGIETRMSEPDAGADSDFAKEQIPVIVLTSENMNDVDNKQQIFADVNRNPKVVTKALNILFDHRDEYAVIAHSIAKDLGQIVDLARNVPTPTSTNALTLTNLHNLVVNFGTEKAKKGGKPTRRTDARGSIFTDQLIQDVVNGVVNSFPMIDELRKNNPKTFSYRTARSVYVCYSSAMMQAIGSELKQATLGVYPEDMPELCKRLITDTDWKLANPIYAPIVKVNEKGAASVGTRTDDVAAACNILSRLWGPMIATMREEKK